VPTTASGADVDPPTEYSGQEKVGIRNIDVAIRQGASAPSFIGLANARDVAFKGHSRPLFIAQVQVRDLDTTADDLAGACLDFLDVVRRLPEVSNEIGDTIAEPDDVFQQHTEFDRLDLELTAALLLLGGGGAAHGGADKSFRIGGTASSQRHNCSHDRPRDKDRNSCNSSKHIFAKYVANARLIATVDTDRDHEVHGDYGADDRADYSPDHRRQ
jgi:hypothetical protein